MSLRLVEEVEDKFSLRREGAVSGATGLARQIPHRLPLQFLVTGIHGAQLGLR